MKVIILAAGVGKRMSAVTNSIPKCLIKIGKKTLLENYLESFSALGLQDIVIVVGHHKEKIQEMLKNRGASFNIRYIENEQYTKGSILSLWYARNELNEETLIMDADVLYHEKLLEKLVSSKDKNCFLLDEDFEDSGEEMKLFVVGGKVIGISKQSSYDCELVGEGVGFLKLSAKGGAILKDVLEEFERNGKVNVEYEDALHELLPHCTVGFERVGDLPWIEIDFEADIEKANNEILPRLQICL
ncbi:MAG: phosphocholine cytidylyltransferase family protein [Candidatus Scalindua sp. AMX11]|nr:MAG: phosphocholine cytidylyltransferase family protein [Candidatus Scalindua sp.]RZV96990.1 MAG: phosphocholine cytidylyltransferase family protein [Candidatus Scalindua sp. SCAELEC01]TDE66398.1 MAG: phosphocholine cytidylyltransferase family protein [Candidatus Scalindua sp. AMX11]GJQ58211.1 MAG: ADP-glucose pyrophosphorylase [Candidatus Scalindua sp.]